ncbi:hypothetical protein LLH03_03760 [bacterium]|nr:hypothetical protein [bacterium]
MPPSGPNPFEPLEPEAFADPYLWPPEALRFLKGEGDCLQVLGGEGMGKTTLLRLLQRELEATGVRTQYACLPAVDTVELPGVEPGVLVLLDEADRLSRGELGELLRHLRESGGRLVLGTHRSLAAQVRRAGLTCLEVRLRPLRRIEELRALLQTRLRQAGWHLDDWLPEAAARRLLAAGRGNPLRCLQLAYELGEEVGSGHPVSPEDVRRAESALTRALS